MPGRSDSDDRNHSKCGFPITESNDPSKHRPQSLPRSDNLADRNWETINRRVAKRYASKSVYEKSRGKCLGFGFCSLTDGPCDLPPTQLPRASYVVQSELVGVAGPVWLSTEVTSGSRTRRICTATKLMINRMIRVLANAPRIRLTHVSSRWDDQCKRLSVLLVVIPTVPGSIHCEVVGPNLSDRIRISRVGFLRSQRSE